MKKVYTTNEWKGYGKQNYYWNEYRTDGETITKVKCNRHKHFDGNESTWVENETEETSWDINDPNMPNWLNKYL